MNSFEAFMLALGPGWLYLTVTGRAYQAGKGAAFDELLTLYSEAVQARIIATADADALYRLGSERGIDLYADEPLEAYRRRVQGAWEFWRWAGTNRGILTALEQMGYRARITEYFNSDKWAEFSIDFTPTEIAPSSAKYDDPATVYDDPAVRYDVYMNASEIYRVRAVVNKVKAAQSRLSRLTFVLEMPARYDEPGAIYDAPDTVYSSDTPYQVDL